MKSKITKQLLFGFIFTLLLTPTIEDIFSFTSMEPLKGSFIPTEKEDFNSKNWFEGIYQKAYERWYEENIDLRIFLIRAYNQVDYTFFNTAHGDVVAGKKGQLFEERYLNAYIGKDFIGEHYINACMHRISFVTDYLKHKGIHVIIAFAPSKAEFYPEYIPSFYSRHKHDSTNYDSWKKMLASSNVPFVDFNDFFLKVKDTSNLMLYPKQGVHWSQYGMYLAVDSLLKFMRAKTGIDLKTLSCERIEMSHDLKSSDYDVGNVCNLLFQLKHDDMPYPVLRWEENSSKQQPNLLVIGDSYVWNLCEIGLFRKVFNGTNFLYYNAQAYTDTTSGPQPVDSEKYMPVVEKQQVVLIFQTLSNLDRLGFEFFENAYMNLKDTAAIPELIEYYENGIRKHSDMLQLATKKAIEKNIPVNEMIRRDAEWTVNDKMNKR
jgi:hypothetical protein